MVGVCGICIVLFCPLHCTRRRLPPLVYRLRAKTEGDVRTAAAALLFVSLSMDMNIHAASLQKFQPLANKDMIVSTMLRCIAIDVFAAPLVNVTSATRTRPPAALAMVAMERLLFEGTIALDEAGVLTYKVQVGNDTVADRLRRAQELWPMVVAIGSLDEEQMRKDTRAMLTMVTAGQITVRDFWKTPFYDSRKLWSVSLASDVVAQLESRDYQPGEEHAAYGSPEDDAFFKPLGVLLKKQRKGGFLPVGVTDAVELNQRARTARTAPTSARLCIGDGNVNDPTFLAPAQRPGASAPTSGTTSARGNSSGTGGYLEEFSEDRNDGSDLMRSRSERPAPRQRRGGGDGAPSTYQFTEEGGDREGEDEPRVSASTTGGSIGNPGNGSPNLLTSQATKGKVTKTVSVTGDKRPAQIAGLPSVGSLEASTRQGR